MSWTQAICGACWQAYSYGRDGYISAPVRMKEEHRSKDVCCFCSGEAEQGIYIRVDPNTIPFPTKDEE